MKLVPFYANTPDGTHCLQAALRSVLKYYTPEKEYTWEELEKMTAKKEGLWTWGFQAAISMKQLGFDVDMREDFDYEKFIEKGEVYLKEKFGEEVAGEQIKHSDIVQEKKLTNEYIKLFGVKNGQLPTFEELKKLIDKGYLVVANVNSRKLNAKPGYVGHFVVVYHYDENNLYLHDPGLPPQEARTVTNETFVKAWEFPDEKARSLIAFRHTD